MTGSSLRKTNIFFVNPKCDFLIHNSRRWTDVGSYIPSFVLVYISSSCFKSQELFHFKLQWQSFISFIDDVIVYFVCFQPFYLVQLQLIECTNAHLNCFFFAQTKWRNNKSLFYIKKGGLELGRLKFVKTSRPWCF